MRLLRARKAASELLLNQRSIRPYFNIEKMKFGDRTILFDTVQNYATLTGIPINILMHDRQSPLKDGLILHDTSTNIYVVLYNGMVEMEERIRWTKAHELGHVLLGHTSNEDMEELEADTFAAQLLMPWFSIRMMSNFQKPSADHIARTFGVSITAANRRIMDVKRYSGPVTEMDKRIWDKQKKYILPEKREPLPIDVLNKVIYASNR